MPANLLVGNCSNANGPTDMSKLRKMRSRLLVPITIAGILLTTKANAIDITTTFDSNTLASTVLQGHSSGVYVQDNNYWGDDYGIASGTYKNLSFAPLSNISTGIVMTTGSAQGAKGPNNTSSYSVINGGGPFLNYDNYDGKGSNIDLYDVATLAIGFTCYTEQHLSFEFAFGSEEYYEYVNSPYNDCFFSFLDSNPISLSRDSNGDAISVNNNFFHVDNRPKGWEEYDANGENYSPCKGTAAGISELQYDGFTPSLKTTFTVEPGYHSLYFVIGDAGDHNFDSGVFLTRALWDSTDPDGTHEVVVPEPASASILGFGILALIRRNKRKSNV